MALAVASSSSSTAISSSTFSRLNSSSEPKGNESSLILILNFTVKLIGIEMSFDGFD